MILRPTVVAAVMLYVVPFSLLAQKQTLQVDPAKSEVHFTLADPVHAVHGTFKVQSGNIVFDPKDGSMSGGIAVDARSGETGNGSRDKKMANDQMKASTFSTVTFAPKQFTGTLPTTGDGSITVNGTFTLLGTPHEISVPMQVHLDGGACKATGSFPIPYVQWGMKDPSNFLLKVGKEVTVDLVLVGPLTAGA